VLNEGELAEERSEEIMNALTIGEQSVREVMIPPEEIVALSTEDAPESNFRKLEEHPHTRYPLIGEDLTEFRGIVYSPALFNRREELSAGNGAFTELAAPTMTLSPDTDVSDAIDQFQAERQEIALVIEDGDAVGLVTVTDLLETIIGDIEDTLDQDNPDIVE
jgi:IMP dehydrogenase